MTQRDENPYCFSDSNKRYQTYDYFTRHTFGGKCAKIPLDAGFSCPNKDGSRGRGGCIFCLSGSAASVCRHATIREQFDAAAAALSAKWSPSGYIPYLQAGTNTYAEPEQLRAIYEEAAGLPGAVMLDIATRADCLGKDVICELLKISEKIPVTVELGLQSSCDKTAQRIGRGHSFEEFTDGYRRLRSAGGNIRIGIHIINGLPGEKRADMLKSAHDVASLAPDAVKFHLLCVLRGTQLAEIWKAGDYIPMEREEYVETVCDQIELMPAETVIDRVTGDAPSEVLLAPLWCRRKTEVTNMIDKELYRRGSYQGYRHVSKLNPQKALKVKAF